MGAEREYLENFGRVAFSRGLGRLVFLAVVRASLPLGAPRTSRYPRGWHLRRKDAP